ncbi:4-phosphoerythronate dehydrogenase [Legionella impletisoli]|uniref:Erythronate-4-phosphate dehydrogenase n=1 Tax=Legionella impletisoli TaxID=343510 RepID=A0A917JS61_9GAMM|nr:4-phosphoerythronate dehydrogenase [Legionella impletisoli]GGI79780.1 erythronate-4-phosphate dehydrogenase [Legionella impletisoli]
MIVLADATLPGLAELFAQSFNLRTYRSEEELKAFLHDSDVLICRSTLNVNQDLLKNSSVRYVATASSGIDHLDTNYLATQGIQWFDAKGSNAHAVADYVVASIAYLQQAHLLQDSRAGIIGFGEVGSRVYSRLLALGFEVLCVDPFKVSQNKGFTFHELHALESCSLLTIHANLHHASPYPSYNLIDEAFLHSLANNTVMINASRGGIVNEQALLNSQKSLIYCTDVFLNEPDINPQIINYATLCTPHIAGHSLEAKQNAVIYLSQQLHETLGLDFTFVPSDSKQPLPCTPNSTWGDCVLNLYNPMNETIALKQAVNKKEAFISLRKAHHFRHDFNQYDKPHLNPTLKKILGSPNT